MDKEIIQRFAFPFGMALVSFLAYPSQVLFYYIEPGPLRKGDAYIFNALVACCLISFHRTCFTDPGRIPSDWQEKLTTQVDDAQASQRQRWCRKCEAFKPPRAHHCKTCKRSV